MSNFQEHLRTTAPGIEHFPCSFAINKQAMPFKERTFVKLCHSKLFDITAALLNELCHYGATEPVILSVVDKNLLLSFTNTKDWIHLNVGFGWWVRRYLPSLRVSGLRIFRYHSKTIEQWIESVTLNKLGKKQNQNFRIFEMQHSFYDPVFHDTQCDGRKIQNAQHQNQAN